MLESILWNKVKEDASLEVWGNLVSFCTCSQLGQLNGSFALSVKTPNSGVHQKAVSMGRSPRSGQETKQVPSPSPQPAAASTGNSPWGKQIPGLLTIVIARIRLEGTQGLHFRVAAFITACKAGHFSRVINPFVFTDSQRESRNDTGYLVHISSPVPCQSSLLGALSSA